MSEPAVSHVESVQSDRILLFVAHPEHWEVVRSLGGKRELLSRSWGWIGYETESGRVALFEALRSAGFAFLGEPAGWPPAAIFEDLRDRGLLEGSYTALTWRGPDQPVLNVR